MGLHTWNQPLDQYDYLQLTNNWQIVDFHDHSPGRGVQITTAGIAAGAVGTLQLASTVPLIPTGGIILWTTAVAPPGYLKCDGSPYSNAVYPTLFAVIGNTFGNTAPTFNVPNITAPVPGTGTVMYIVKT